MQLPNSQDLGKVSCKTPSQLQTGLAAAMLSFQAAACCTHARWLWLASARCPMVSLHMSHAPSHTCMPLLPVACKRLLRGCTWPTQVKSVVQGSGQGNERNNETVQEMKLFKVRRR